MGCRLGKVQRFRPFGDRADQTFAHRQPGDVDGRLVQPARGEQFEHPFAQEVDRTDLAVQAFADDFDDLVEFGLRAGARGHDLVKRRQDSAGGGNGGLHGHGLAQHGRFGNADRRFSIIRMRREKGAGVCRSQAKGRPFRGRPALGVSGFARSLP
jgi:hypothetical protein